MGRPAHGDHPLFPDGRDDRHRGGAGQDQPAAAGPPQVVRRPRAQPDPHRRHLRPGRHRLRFRRGHLGERTGRLRDPGPAHGLPAFGRRRPGTCFCHAHCHRLSRSVGFVTGELRQPGSDEVIAVVNATFMRTAPAPAAPRRHAAPAPGPAPGPEPGIGRSPPGRRPGHPSRHPGRPFALRGSAGRRDAPPGERRAHLPPAVPGGPDRQSPAARHPWRRPGRFRRDRHVSAPGRHQPAHGHGRPQGGGLRHRLPAPGQARGHLCPGHHHPPGQPGLAGPGQPLAGRPPAPGGRHPGPLADAADLKEASMPILTPFAWLLLLCAPTACAMAGEPSPAVAHEIAPGGRLRVAINLGNPVLAQRGPGSALAS